MLIPGEYAAWLCWAIPFAGSLFVPLVAKLRRKNIGWYAVAVTILSVICTISLIPSVLGGHGEAHVYSCLCCFRSTVPESDKRVGA